MSGRVDFDSVQVLDVSRHFGRRRALANISLAARPGDIVGLLGPNGAGKSTLITMLATLAAPSKGEIRYGNQSASVLGPALRTRIGLLAHELHLYPELSARQNLTFFAELYGLDPQGLVDAALESASLADRADEAVSGFSRGMRQRLALERALLHEPRLVLLDEPFTGLDDAATGTLRLRLRELREAGCIVIVTTHDLETIEGLVDRAVVLQHATLTAVAPGAGSLRDRYRTACGAGS